ncbi:spore germination protein [Paenibacillus sp. J2TS4]|uniref:spore germination protein n=1 Tax=Paenibacillus sp. J2TS4 TaxID=2807194 RepID=UPI001BCD54DB|nr:spore germination protein [Paenibacillus sp. J2TS4]
MFNDCSDIVIRPFVIEKNIQALAVFIDGLVISDVLDDALRSLMILEGNESEIDRIVETALPVSQIQTADNYGELLLGILGGDTGIFVENHDRAILLGIRGPETRSVDEPSSESLVRGPREGFIENLRTNTALIRRKVKSPRLKMKPLVVGKHTNTNLVVSYIDGLADPALIDEVVQRIELIDIDSVIESGYIEEMIQDSAYSPFPQMQYTERPDVVASALLQGRVAILVDGTPFALLAPTIFLQLMQAAEDYYERFQIGTLLRWLRYLFLFMSLFTPALYVAITTFHPEMIPTSLLLSVSAAREAIPFPAVIEALIMEIIFEALREAGVRLPKSVGSAVGILGAIVIGQAAVEAGIVSAPMVIVVSITGIASFTIPHFNGAIAIRMLRFPLLILASLFGIFGILLGTMIILGHMANLRSFGVPYLSPIGPTKWSDLKDALIRSPQWNLTTRPSFLGVQNPVRLGQELPEEIKQNNGLKGQHISHPHANNRQGGTQDDQGKE